MEILVYFVVGLVWDVLITLDMIFVIRKRFVAVFFTSFILTILSAGVFTEVLDEMTPWKLLGLATGSGLGGAGTVWVKRKR